MRARTSPMALMVLALAVPDARAGEPVTVLKGLDPVELSTGRVVSASWQGRTQPGIGEVTKSFSDFREVFGMVLPFVSLVSHGGRPASEGPVTLAEVIVNPAFEAGLFSPAD